MCVFVENLHAYPKLWKVNITWQKPDKYVRSVLEIWRLPLLSLRNISLMRISGPWANRGNRHLRHIRKHRNRIRRPHWAWHTVILSSPGKSECCLPSAPKDTAKSSLESSVYPLHHVKDALFSPHSLLLSNYSTTQNVLINQMSSIVIFNVLERLFLDKLVPVILQYFYNIVSFPLFSS